MAAATRAFLLALFIYALVFPRTPAGCGHVRGGESANPERFSIPHMRHVEIRVFLNKLNGRAFVRQNFKRANVVCFAPFVRAFRTSVAIHADIQFPLRAADVDSMAF